MTRKLLILAAALVAAFAFVGAQAQATGPVTLVQQVFGSSGSLGGGGLDFSPTTAGDMLVATVVSSTGNPLTTQFFSVQFPPGWIMAAQTNLAEIWYYPNNPGGITHVDVSTRASSILIGGVEYNGVTTLDQAAGHEGASSPNVVQAPLPDASAGELVVTSSYCGITRADVVQTTDTFNNGASATPLPSPGLSNDDTTGSLTQHYRWSWGVTTSNAGPDQDAFTCASHKKLVVLSSTLASFS